MTSYAIIGSGSFSGSDFIDLLHEDPENKVIGISRSPEKSAIFMPYKRHKGADFTYYQMDMNKDMSRIIDLLDTTEPDYIVNFAAQSEVAPSWQNPDHWFQTNAVALAQLVHALKDRKYFQKYVHISSPEVYGSCDYMLTESAPLNPTTPFAASKAAADLLLFTMVKNFDFPLVMIRSTNVYGAHQQLFKIIPRTVIYLKMGKKIQLHGGGVSVKSNIHIRDVSRGELAAVESGRLGMIYHLSTTQGYAVRDVVRRICELMNYSFEDSTCDVEERLGQDAAYLIDSSRARAEFGWSPQISLDEGLKGVIDWVEEYWEGIQQLSLEYVHQP